ncbi:hypothetical protein [Acidianus ambivalens]|uniref:MFS transporter n=1 Tax=Acidianus ambivalens TaxID=2283 RepID=A0A650CYI9_ACIAM|nr:hypothetical protein [Acidianus ambivalens]MQL54907.1 hypothetical protein [Acidianus ambivalens]QGR22692.1 hypothetical protein D1866_12450 [Acidianus ambivalens]
MKLLLKLAISWILWGIGFYLYYPFLSIFLVRYIKPSELGFFYLTTLIFSLPLPYLGGKINKKFGDKYSIILGMSLSGTGILLLPFTSSIISLYIFMIMYNSFYIALPGFYELMETEGKSTISKVWAISVLPSIFMPSIGGIISQYLGFTYLFIISAFFIIFSFLPLITQKEIKNEDPKIEFYPIISLIILPVALSSQFIYLVIKEMYNLSDTLIGIIATFAELLGSIIAFTSSFISSKKAINLSLILFSLQSLIIISPYFSVFYGLWESIIPLSLSISKKNYVSIVTMQIIGWILGYLIASIIQSPRDAIFLSSVLSLIVLTIINFGKY